MPETRSSDSSTSNEASQMSTKLNVKPLTVDGDFADFSESFKAEMICKRLAHHFPGLVKESIRRKLEEADKNPLSEIDAHALLVLSLDSDLKSLVREAIELEDPAQLWEAILEVMQNENDSTLGEIANQVATIVQGQSEPLVTYIARLDAMHRRLAGTTYDQADPVMWLNLKRGVLPMFKTLVREISRDKHKQKYVAKRTDLIVTAAEYVGDPYKPPSTRFDGSALNTQDADDENKKSKKRDKQRKQRDLSLHCEGCHWKGHLVKDCPNKGRKDRCSKCLKIGHDASSCRSKAATEKANQVNDTDGEDSDDDDYEADFALNITDEPLCEECHTDTPNQTTPADNNDEEKCNAVVEWIVDSGASSHYSTTSEGLQSIKPDGKSGVRTADDRIHTVESTGVHHESYMGKVKIVPGLARNLMSLGVLTDDPNTAVLFQGKECTILKGATIKVKGGTVVGQGTKSQDKLYRINMEHANEASDTHTANTVDDADTDPADSADDDDNDNDSDNDSEDDDDDDDYADEYTEGFTVDGNAIELHNTHESLNHLSKSGMRHLVRMGKLNLTKNVLKAQLNCRACRAGKSHKQNRRKKIKAKIRAEATGELIYSDTCGPFRTPDLQGNVYFQTFIDDRSRIVALYLNEHKDAASTVNNFTHFTNRMEARGHKILRLRTDQGGEYINAPVKAYLSNKGITHEVTGRSASQQNGVAERMNRTILDTVRTLLIASGLPHHWWGHAAKYTTLTRNRVTTATFDHKEIPWERFTLRPVNLGIFRPFGCKAWVHEPDKTNGALDTRGEEGIFVGFDEELRHNLVYVPSKNMVLRSADVTFALGDSTLLRETTQVVQLTEDAKRTTKAKVPSKKRTKAAGAKQPTGATTKATAISSAAGVPESGGKSATEPQLSPTPPASDSTVTAKLDGVLPATHAYGCLTYEEAALSAMKCLARDIPIPPSYEAAVNDPVWGECWRKAFKSELNSHKENKSYEVCDSPEGRKVLHTRWVLKVKEGKDGEVDKFKCRWVIKGYSQIYGVDYELTFAPVSRLTSFRVLLAHAAALGMEVHQMDVSTAFLYADLDEEVYVYPPEGLRHTIPKGKVLRLLKAIFGLKQAPRAWNRCLDKFLRNKVSLKRLKSDPCIYKSEDGTLIVSIYVDDILIMSKDNEKITQVKKMLNSRFKMTDLGKLRWYLGMRIKYHNDRITLDQEQYTTKVLERFNMSNAKPQSTPIVAGADVHLVLNKEDKLTNAPYRELVGCLLYLALSTRPDIAAAIGKLARLVSRPNETHWKIAKSVLRYLAGTLDFGLSLKRFIKARLTGYGDASWADDRKTRNSTTGYLNFYDDEAQSLVDWASKLQGAPAHSTAEAELMAADELARNIVWLRTLFKEIGIEQTEPTVMYEDNEACIKISEGGGSFQAKKHFELRYFYILHLVTKKTVKMVHISTKGQLADILTKLLDRNRFIQLREAIVRKV